jgi:hypothetical protein
MSAHSSASVSLVHEGAGGEQQLGRVHRLKVGFEMIQRRLAPFLVVEVDGLALQHFPDPKASRRSKRHGHSSLV